MVVHGARTYPDSELVAAIQIDRLLEGFMDCAARRAMSPPCEWPPRSQGWPGATARRVWTPVSSLVGFRRALATLSALADRANFDVSFDLAVDLGAQV